MNNRLLSIGSVILLKETDKKVMVVGYYPTFLENEVEITYEYSGCMFPEGIIRSDEILLFNSGDIDKIIFSGLIDEEQNSFMISLNQAVEEEKKSMNLINQNVSSKNNQQEMNDSIIKNNIINQKQVENQILTQPTSFNTLNLNQQNNINN